MAAGTTIVLQAIDRLFRGRRASFATSTRAAAAAQMPGAPQSRLDALVAQEMQYEVEYQRKARARLEANLPRVLAQPDEARRALDAAQVLTRERQFLGQRERAAAQRVVGALEMDLIRQQSPQGAYWQLSPLIREHCPTCLALAGKFWPWEVYDLPGMHLPLHPNCGCRLLTLQEAVAAGLMREDQVPDTEEAVGRAKMILREVRRLRETMAPEDFEQALEHLRENYVRSAEHAAAARWSTPQVKPRKPLPPGLAAADVQLLQEMAVQVSPAELSARRFGRSVVLGGEETFIPQADPFYAKSSGHTYSSPPGTTRLYRDGILMPWDHPDLGGPVPQVDPELPDGTVDERKLIPDYRGVSLTVGEALDGSPGSAWAADADGNRWLIKTHGGDQDRVAAELVANALYRLAGARAPVAGTLPYGGSIAVAYPTLEARTPSADGVPAAAVSFAADALLANWDAATADNLLQAPDGGAVKVGASCAFVYRADGGRRPFGPVPVELWTLSSQRAGAQAMRYYDTRGQLRQILTAVDDEVLEELFTEAPFRDEELRDGLRDALAQRLAWSRAYVQGLVGLPEAREGGDAQRALASWAAPMPPEAAAAAAAVRGGSDLAGQVQGWLASPDSGEAPDAVRGMIDALDQALVQTKDDLTLYASGTLGQQPEALVGQQLYEPRYLGLTANRGAARRAGDVLVQVLVPAGTRAAPLVAPGADGGPDVLVARGSRLLVTGVTTSANWPLMTAVVLPS